MFGFGGARESGMNFDLSKILEQLGDPVIAQIGGSLGLSAQQSQQLAQALSRHFSTNREATVEAAAADTGFNQDVVAAMLGKLVEEGKKHMLEGGGASEMIGGALGGLFGKK